LGRGAARRRLSKFLAHLKDNACRGDQELFLWVQAFFADIFQNPADKKDVSLVLKGRPGTGKTFIADVVGSLMGRHYVSVSDQRYVTGRFNSHQGCCLLLDSDEAFWAGDKENEGKLRGMVSGKKHPIEYKGKEPEFVDNHMRLMVTGEADWQVPAVLRERRFATLEMGEDHIQDHPYFAAIEEEMSNGGREALLHHLLTFDLTKVELRKIPRTAALAEQQIASLSTENEWWLDVLRPGELPDPLEIENRKHCCRSKRLYESYLHRTNQSGRRRRAMETALGSFLKKALKDTSFDKIRPTVEQGGKKVRFWASVFCLAQPDLVAVMSLDHSDLELVVRYVAEERRIVARQRELIARLRAAGASTSGAEETLKVFEANLAIFEERERDLRQKG
jgi:hypothetical protein